METTLTEITEITEQSRPRRKVQGVTLPPEIQERVLALAKQRDWSAAQTGGYLIKLGFQLLDQQNAETAQQAA